MGDERRSEPYSACTMHSLAGTGKRRGAAFADHASRLTCLKKNDTPSRHHHPTMFKRVDRRRKRKENEESLGLDEDQWGVFGLHHTDSSESDSDSSDSASTSSSDGHSTKKKRKRGASPRSYDESSEDEDGEPATDDENDDEGSSNHGTHPSLTIASALKEPIRLIGPHSEGWMCVFCPGKTLKHTAMVKVHEASQVRRL